MENTFYQSLIAQLSESEQPIFEQLLLRLEQLDGNLELLSEEEQAKLAELVAHHNTSNAANNPDSELTPDVDNELSASVVVEPQPGVIFDVTTEKNPATTEFGAYLLDSINESLCQGGASTADAIRYAFHNRWMPETLKNRDICEDLYYRYFDDIDKANKSIQQHSPSHANNDTVVAVGLAWFTTLYLCYQFVEAEGEI